MARVKVMRARDGLDTTLGDLIIAITDEVDQWVHDQTAAYFLVSCILADLVGRGRVRQTKRRRAVLH